MNLQRCIIIAVFLAFISLKTLVIATSNISSVSVTNSTIDIVQVNSSTTPWSVHHGNETGHQTVEHETDSEHDAAEGHHSSTIHVVDFNFEYVKGPLLVAIVISVAGLSKIGFHHANFLSSKVPESCILIILGLVFGGIVFFSGAKESFNFFEPRVFFLYLLPPIILEAAFSLHNRTFTDNLGSIIMFSVVGTVIACFTIGLTLFGLNQVGAMEDTGADLVQMLVFSALIVAVDPVAVLAIFQEVGVNNMLYFLVFGESLLNDGVTVVLYNVMQTYNRMDTIEADQIVLGIVKFLVVVFGGLLVGILLGLLASFVTKFTNSVKVVEPIIIFTFAYMAYILAEMFHFSGIISIIACGLVEMQYAFNNITSKSRLACKFFAKVISNMCEIIIFLFLGVKTVHPNHVWNTGFILWTTLLCVVYRFVITFVIAIGINFFDQYRVRRIKLDEMFMISYGGLRGAVCFSLVALLDTREFPMKDLFVTTTLFVIFFTVFFQGGTIKWLVKKLRVTLQDKNNDMIMYQELNHHITDHLMAAIEQIVGVSGKNLWREKFDRLDDQYIRQILLKNPKKCDLDEMSQYYEKLMMKEHYKNLRLCGASNLPNVPSALRMVDSSACLKVMDDSDEQAALEHEEKIADRRSRLFSQNSVQEAESSEGVNLKKLLRSALTHSKHRGGFHFHDKNFTGDEKRHMVGQLRQRYRRNRALSTMSRPGVERALSWNDDHGTMAMRRTSDTRLKMRAQTVDLTPTGDEFKEIAEPMPAHFVLDDTVFEEGEDEGNEATEVHPLVTHMNHQHKGSGRHVTFRQSSLDGQTSGMPKHPSDLGTEIRDRKKGSPSNSDIGNNNTAVVNVIKTSESDAVTLSITNDASPLFISGTSDTKEQGLMVPSDGGSRSPDRANVVAMRSASHDSHQLLRQNAVRDSEIIEMKDMDNGMSDSTSSSTPGSTQKAMRKQSV